MVEVRKTRRSLRPLPRTCSERCAEFLSAVTAPTDRTKSPLGCNTTRVIQAEILAACIGVAASLIMGPMSTSRLLRLRSSRRN
ncbi:hypothetical protein GCM10023334_117370 [Nonomuraea thailandensis]